MNYKILDLVKKLFKLLYACDVHGSERAYIKFLNAGRLYKADTLILGGDLTGKFIIPFVRSGSYYRINFLGEEKIAKTKEEVDKIESIVRRYGYYPYFTDPEEVEELRRNKEKLNHIFKQLMMESIKRWLNIAIEKLKGTEIKIFIMPGNDDPYEIDKIFGESEFVVNPEGKVVNVNSSYEMVSTGYSNITPWHAPRDIQEQELEKKLEEMISKVGNMERCIFNTHCPPLNTSLDLAPKLDENLKPIIMGGQQVMVHVGCSAVRSLIEKYQPLIGLHGHIHESRGVARIGKTLCLNPGSEYAEGILRGVLVNLDNGKVKSYMFISG